METLSLWIKLKRLNHKCTSFLRQFPSNCSICGSLRRLPRNYRRA